MQNGLYIDDISLPNVKVTQLYIKWNEKVAVSIKEILISKKNSDSNSKVSYEDVGHYFKKLSLINNWFENITIEQIVYNDTKASFKYKYGERGYLVASSKDFHFKSSLYFESQFLNMDIKELVDLKRKISLDGTLFFNPYNLDLTSDLNININGDLDAKILLNANTKRLIYKLKANKSIKDITHLIKIANLPKEAVYWAYDAINMSNLVIDSATGYIDFDNIKEAYKNIHIKATANKLNYAYDTKLDAIHTQTTLLEFKKGVLYIRPQEAYTYGVFLDKSWLKIDFTTKDETLTLHLLFDGTLNKDMLTVLNRYKIKLPFLQREGAVSTNLTLVVNLMTIDIDVEGDFFTKKANFDYLGLNVDIYDAYIKLNNYDVLINNMKAKYKDIASGKVNVKFNAKTSRGSISLKPEHINLAGATLIKDKKPIEIVYNISQENDTIEVDASKWQYDDFILKIEKTTMPFNLETLLVEIPTTYVEVDDIGSAFISGQIPVDTMKMKLRADVLKFHYADIELAQSNTPLNISYDDKIHIAAHTNVLLNVNGFEYDINNIAVDIGSSSFKLNDVDILSTNGLIAMQVAALYSTEYEAGTLVFKNVKIENRNQLLYEKEKALFSFSMPNGDIKASAKNLGLDFNMTSAGWSAKLNSLSTISPDSKLLQNLKLQEGKIVFNKQKESDFIDFKANVKYPYKLLIKNNTAVSDYTIKGNLNSKKSFININDNIDIKVSDKINIDVNRSIISIPELVNVFNDINLSSNNKNSKSIIIKALNSTLNLGNDRRILSDTINLQHHKEITTAQLEHKKGFAGFKLDNNKIHLYGENFGDKFMENLFSLSRFKGGKLNFSMNGTIKNYDGLFYITDTTIVDYKMLNNILAFVNTVPSLTTFSLPGYSKSGLKVSSAYMNFNAKSSVFNISDFFLDSKEIDILGSGVADVPKDKIDITLNLKTDLGSSASKIPLVGYVILGDDAISTTMSITGKLSDPTVRSLIAKEILVAPINIVKRALLLPYDLLKDKKDKDSKK